HRGIEKRGPHDDGGAAGRTACGAESLTFNRHLTELSHATPKLRQSRDMEIDDRRDYIDRTSLGVTDARTGLQSFGSCRANATRRDLASSTHHKRGHNDPV